MAQIWQYLGCKHGKSGRTRSSVIAGSEAWALERDVRWWDTESCETPVRPEGQLAPFVA